MTPHPTVTRKTFKAKEFTNEIKFMIDEDYPNFKNFYKNSKEIIYRKIVDVFINMKSPEDEILLTVYARIDGCEFDTDFIISKSKSDWMKKVINPFFEEIEDYETCGKIFKFCS